MRLSKQLEEGMDRAQVTAACRAIDIQKDGQNIPRWRLYYLLRSLAPSCANAWYIVLTSDTVLPPKSVYNWALFAPDRQDSAQLPSLEHYLHTMTQQTKSPLKTSNIPMPGGLNLDQLRGIIDSFNLLAEQEEG